MRYGNTKRKHDPIEVESDPEDLAKAAVNLDKLFAVPRAPKEEKIPLAPRPEHLPGVLYCKHCDRPITPEFAYAPSNPKSKIPLCKRLDCKQYRKSFEALLMNPDLDGDKDDSEDEGDAVDEGKKIVRDFQRPQELADDFASSKDKKAPEIDEQQEKKDDDEEAAQQAEESIATAHTPIRRRLDDAPVNNVKSDQDRFRELQALSDLDDVKYLPFWHHERSLREGPLRPRREPAESAIPAKIDEIKLLGLAAKALVKKRKQKEELAKRRKLDERVRLDKVLKKANHSLKGLYRLTPRKLVKLLKKLTPCPLTIEESAFYPAYIAYWDRAPSKRNPEKFLAEHGAWAEQAIITIENRIIHRAIDDGLLKEIFPGDLGGGCIAAEDIDHLEEAREIIKTGGSTLGGRIHGGRLPDRVPGSRKGVGHRKLEDFRTAPTSKDKGSKTGTDNKGVEHDDYGEESTPE